MLCLQVDIVDSLVGRDRTDVNLGDKTGASPLLIAAQGCNSIDLLETSLNLFPIMLVVLRPVLTWSSLI